MVLLEGVGTHLGMRSRWRLAFADGAEGTAALAFADEVALVPDGAPGASAAPLEARSGFDPALEEGEGGAWAESLGGGVSFETHRARGLREAYLERLAERRAALMDTARRCGWRCLIHRTDESPRKALLWLYGAIGDL